MALSPIFKLREEVSSGIIDLLSQTTLGTNGAKYRHLDTPQRILEADQPLFLSMERNEKVIGNITFCRRGQDWYLRYFAFHSLAQAGNQKKSQDKSNSFLKRELGQFFDDAFSGTIDGHKVRSMYAYIDPKNERSKWMSENFGFKVIRQLVTQSYSRFSPKTSDRLQVLKNYEEIRSSVEKVYGDHSYFFTTHSQKSPFYILRNEFDEIVAFTRVTRVKWIIERLPGRFGAQLIQIIPHLPYLNKLIQPKDHEFLVPEIVFVKENNSDLLEELFSAILAKEKLHLILWWVDAQDPLYVSVKSKMKWGPFHKLIGSAPVDVVQRTGDGKPIFSDKPVFVSAWDMV